MLNYCKGNEFDLHKNMQLIAEPLIRTITGQILSLSSDRKCVFPFNVPGQIEDKNIWFSHLQHWIACGLMPQTFGEPSLTEHPK